MTSHVEESPSVAEVCARVERLGYGIRQHVRLYGEEFEVMSKPFPDADGISVQAKTERHEVRVVRLPATVLQSVQGKTSKAA